MYFLSTDSIKRTVKIETSTVEIEERGVKLRLTIVDTPGYGDGMDNKDRLVLHMFLQDSNNCTYNGLVSVLPFSTFCQHMYFCYFNLGTLGSEG